MHRRFRFLAVTILFLLTGSAGSVLAQAGSSPDFSELPLTYEESTDPQQQQYNLYDFIWRSFSALNWPNVPLKIEGSKIVSGERGNPDASRSLSVMSGSNVLPQTVWETYKEPFEVFPPKGEKPQEWNSVRPVPPKLAIKLEGARTMLAFPIELTGYATDENQPYFFFRTSPARCTTRTKASCGMRLRSTGHSFSTSGTFATTTPPSRSPRSITTSSAGATTRPSSVRPSATRMRSPAISTNCPNTPRSVWSTSRRHGACLIRKSTTWIGICTATWSWASTAD